MMMSIWRKLPVLFVLLMSSMMFLNPVESPACSCIQLSVEEAYEKFDVIFSGRVYQIHNPRAGDPVQSSATLLQNFFEVKEVWKGELDQTVVVRASQSSASCGYEFVLNQEYLVYATDKGDWIQTSICDRSQLLSQADEDLQFLGPGQLNTLYGQIALPEERTKFDPALILIMSSILVVIAVVSLLWWRKVPRR
jgi:hypothetical protein